MYPRFLCWLPKYCLSMPSKRSLQIWRMVIDNLIVNDVRFFFFLVRFFVWLRVFFFVLFSFCAMWFGFSFWVLCDFQMSLDPWFECEEHAECEWAQELNGHQVLFECGHGRYWYLGDRMLAQVQHMYPPAIVLVHPFPFIRMVDLLANEEIAHARVDHCRHSILHL